MNSMEKELEDKQRKRMPFLVAFLAIFILTGIILVSIVATITAEEPEERPYLVVEEVFFVISNPEDFMHEDMVTIEVTAYFTNRGTADANEVDIIAYAIDKNTNVAMDKTSYSIGTINEDKTKSADFSLTMPNGDSYEIKLLIFESGKIAVRGSGTVTLLGGSGASGSDFHTDNGGSRSPLDGEERFGMAALSADSSLGVILVVGGAIVVLILIGLLSSGSKKSSQDRVPPYGIDNASSVPGSPGSSGPQGFFGPQEPPFADAILIRSDGESTPEEGEQSTSEEDEPSQYEEE